MTPFGRHASYRNRSMPQENLNNDVEKEKTVHI